VLLAQAAAMNLPLHTANASWEHYEAQFKDRLHTLRCNGMTHGVFGDIDLVPHREWVERVCRECDITALLPLWQESRSALIREFIATGFKALIVVVNTSKMPERFLGRSIDSELVNELEQIGVDACGENGEYHSFVYDGPLFTHPLTFKSGQKVSIESYAFLPLETDTDARAVSTSASSNQ
jgi:uncharacterized protein (TIGR00290 family)